MDSLIKAKIFDAVAVASTGSATSNSVDIRRASRVEAVILKASSVAGTTDVKVEYATSHDDSSYDSFDDNVDITSSSATQFANNVEGFNTYPVPAPLNAYLKIKVTGVGANNADTLVTGYLLIREET